MMNLCRNCGVYRADKVIDPTGPFAVCPVCGHKQPFRQLPLLMVSGASGTGKSTVCNSLTGTIEEAVFLDSDVLWRAEFDHPENNYREFMELWLRVCKNISQSGRPVVLFGAGTGVPMNIEPCVERRYFTQIHYLALVCDNEEIAGRLEARGNWPMKGDLGYLAKQVEFNTWFKEDSGKLGSKIDLIDTTNVPVNETADKVALWIHKSLGY